ncbi:hypothetical protein K1T71_012415 [Dendrolimus kikuchii]|uniref:Uncharacterized protein n=1 Tax=Dendrolimus kikuchii TaxID=765133 RepID=A0ACC1CJL1_9NEOP|nr:hypothetical protein K1T71_012415 [Dendrolimus kikuchii]
MRGLFCVFALLFAAGISAQLEEDYELPEDWKDYDNFYDYGMIKEETEKLLPKSEEVTRIEKEVQDNIEKYKNEGAGIHDLENSYQIEDNRSNEERNDQSILEESKEKSTDKQAIADDYNLLWGDSEVKDTKIEFQEGTTKKDEESVIDEVIDKDPKAGADNDYHLLWGDDDMAPLPVPEEDDNILDVPDNLFEAGEDDEFDEAIPAEPVEEIDEKLLKETLELLREDEKNGNNLDNLPLPVPNQDLNKDLLEETKTVLNDVDKLYSMPEDFKQNIEDIVDETKKLLEEGNSSNEENIPEQKEDNLEDEIAKLANEIDKAQDRLDNGDDDDDTVDDAMDNLNDDLDKLFDTLDKLKEGVEEANGKVQDKIEDLFGSDDTDLFDDFDGDNDDLYKNIGDSNLSEIFAKMTTAGSELNAEDDDDNMARENIDEISKEILAEEEKIHISNEKQSSNESEENVSNAEEEKEERLESMQADAEEKPIMYENDALLDGDSKQDESLVEQFNADDLTSSEKVDEHLDDDETPQSIEDSVENNDDEKKQSTKMVDDLNSEELDALMEQFKLVHSDDLQVKSESSPIHIKLSVDEPVIITSPNYPNPYPTNNIIDWIFEGDGMGIELIIEDFAVNGALGDYLLVKPGGVDESGQEGLVFSYRLESERKYRFMDVNRMFVRFEARLGMMFMRGFKFSVRMISPPPKFEHIHLPPEDLIVAHDENLTLILGGLSVIDFQHIKEEFRVILADMAEKYIMEHDIDPGLNSTQEVTKIVKTAVCNIRWPNYEHCVEVTFSIPLRYENETAELRLNSTELQDMWQRFSHTKPFAMKLFDLGIIEFTVPDSRSAMTAWTVIAFGVLISVAMLAIALWRFSCFEDYTRMRAFNDTDSLKNEKRNLDLYPTPHQTLPPLYAESEYKWHDDKYDGSTRVDLGGYANRSYVRDEMYGFDSDEDVIPTRERSPEISPRDIYSDV